MHFSKFPERSYWECEWVFPTTGSPVAIALQEGEDGPRKEAREFYLTLPERFQQILVLCRPQLEQVFKEWLNRPLPEDIFGVLRLSVFGLEDASEHPVRWDVSFETALSGRPVCNA